MTAPTHRPDEGHDHWFTDLSVPFFGGALGFVLWRQYEYAVTSFVLFLVLLITDFTIWKKNQ